MPSVFPDFTVYFTYFTVYGMHFQTMKYAFLTDHFDFSWEQLAIAFWQRYPNPQRYDVNNYSYAVANICVEVTNVNTFSIIALMYLHIHMAGHPCE